MPVFPGKRVAAAARGLAALQSSGKWALPAGRRGRRPLQLIFSAKSPLLLAFLLPFLHFVLLNRGFVRNHLQFPCAGPTLFRKNAKGCLAVKTIPQKLAALALVCALAVSLAGCGVNVTGVALDRPLCQHSNSRLHTNGHWLHIQL